MTDPDKIIEGLKEREQRLRRCVTLACAFNHPWIASDARRKLKGVRIQMARLMEKQP